MSQPEHTHAPSRAFAQCSDEGRAPAWLVTTAACLLHAGLFGAALYLSAPAPTLAAKPTREPLLEVELAPPPEPEPVRAPEPEPEQPEPIKLKVAKVEPITPPPAEKLDQPEPEKPAEQAPPPAAAAAGAALTANDDAPAALADTLVTGDAARYAGGTTERGGTHTEAVHAPSARATGVPEGTGTAPVVDRSREPRLAAGTDWSCPFPPEAEEEGIDHAVVGLEVEVAPSGAVLAVTIRSDPGSGFGREARACALKKHWLPALDKAGQPVQRKHHLNVTFTQK